MSQAQILPVEHFSPSVSLVEGRPATTSLAIAECFGKRHDDVIKSIRNLHNNCSEEFRARNFAETFRTIARPNNSERQEKFFIIYFNGFILLVMGYTGRKALQMKLAYIETFNAMREKLESRSKPVAKAEPVGNPDKLSLPPVDAPLTPDHQCTLQAIVKAKIEVLPEAQRKGRVLYPQIWSRFNNHFRIARYCQLPQNRMGEAIDYLMKLELAPRALPEPEPSSIPASLPFRENYPADMDAGRKDALKRIQRLTWSLHAALDVVRLFNNPKWHPENNKGISNDIAMNLYRTAEANLVAAYNALEAGYRLGRQNGRG